MIDVAEVDRLRHLVEAVVLLERANEGQVRQVDAGEVVQASEVIEVQVGGQHRQRLVGDRAHQSGDVFLLVGAGVEHQRALLANEQVGVVLLVVIGFANGIEMVGKLVQHEARALLGRLFGGARHGCEPHQGQAGDCQGTGDFSHERSPLVVVLIARSSGVERPAYLTGRRPCGQWI
ncbi:hypothetical protein D3C80_1388950 [compost metagenome]